MVVGHRIHESREYSDVRVLCNRCRIKVNSGDWVNLEDSVARVVHGGRVSVGKEPNICGMVSLHRVSRTCSST